MSHGRKFKPSPQAEIQLSRLSFDLDAALLRNAAGLYDDVVVETPLAAHPRRDLFGGAAQRDGELFVVRVEALVAQTLQERESGGVVRAAVVERILISFKLVL